MNNTKTSPKYELNQRVVYRVNTGKEVYDLRCKVLDVIHSEVNGYSYKLSGLKDYLASDNKPESEIRPDTGVIK